MDRTEFEKSHFFPLIDNLFGLVLLCSIDRNPILTSLLSSALTIRFPPLLAAVCRRQSHRSVTFDSHSYIVAPQLRLIRKLLLNCTRKNGGKQRITRAQLLCRLGNYFLAKESGKSGKKSARKLSEIDLVDEQELRAEVSNIEPKHEKEIASLINSYKSQYNDWVFELRYGFGLLMYGFGSKKSLIEDFASTALTDYSVIVVNGYLQSINLKQVAIAMAEVLWDQLKMQQPKGLHHKDQQPFDSRSMDDVIGFLDGPHISEDECLLCLVIHNIDGPGLRDSDSQHLLARIASCSHVCIVASIDHVNAPLLWDKKMVHVEFKWCWHHVPTFAAYKVEGVFHPLILAHGGTSQTVKTASIVLHSLTPNAQSVFKVLAQHQLAHPDQEGMPIDTLFTSCRERFLVSSLVTLNSHLTEFKDHELVKIRRHSDGQDCLYIPLSKDALEKLVLEINQ
ncbi:unnamed protein product [Lactuca saligna]|uniref:Origin recognition complex subunit 2 n=1 Tax=Lactuca saligna TaxID=75948 RepID=A0AA35YCI2_LACSI|nr:unnamed protein product [Lactuca saligna]